MQQQVRKPRARRDELLSFNEALSTISEGLLVPTSTAEIKVGGFYEFVRDTWSKSYERPDLFKTWHVGVICSDYERAKEERKNYAYCVSRYHLKSTLAYAFAVYMFLDSVGTKFDASGLYISYSDPMSLYHIAEMKKIIRRNEELSTWMKDKTPQADFAFRYSIKGVGADLLHGGLFSFKRGTHVNRFLIADDLLRDPDNPLNLNQLYKAEEHFMTETIHIPVNNAITVVLGTPMAPDDLLTKLRDDERFIYRALPALDPAPGHRVLCPEIRTEEQLLREQAIRPRAFASEMMLQPYLTTNSYINEEEIRACENPLLKSVDAYKEQEFDSELTVAGADIGKKRHPSHVTVFKGVSGKMVQIFQMFLDGWDYTTQVEFLNNLTKNLHIDKAYYDNTRGELEERSLTTTWRPMTFTTKSKHMMAQVFESFVHNKLIELIVDDRQRSQITCVDGNLDAPDTPMGHGDSYFSNALACLAYHESSRRGTFEVGNLAEFSSPVSTKAQVFNPYRKEYTTTTTGCPQCGEAGGWIAERKLCLICQYRG